MDNDSKNDWGFKKLPTYEETKRTSGFVSPTTPFGSDYPHSIEGYVVQQPILAPIQEMSLGHSTAFKYKYGWNDKEVHLWHDDFELDTFYISGDLFLRMFDKKKQFFKIGDVDYTVLSCNNRA